VIIVFKKEERYMKEYRVKVTVRNNLLLSAIEDAGYKTQAEFARAAGLTDTHVTALVGLRACPIRNDGTFTDVAQTMMEVLGACPTDLWTNEQLSMRLKNNSAEGQMSKAELLPALGMNPIDLIEFKAPDEYASDTQRTAVVANTLKTLTFREQMVLGQRFGINGEEKTYEEIGESLGLTRERIRQLEARALCKLRHPSRSDELKNYLEE
jgi:RNA polymerase sigma factor (sigma-70 family)